MGEKWYNHLPAVARPIEGPGDRGGVAAFDGVIGENGAVIFVWEELDGTILAQKISSEGEALWPEGGVQVDISEYSVPQVISDGSGGAIIAWIRGLHENGWEVRAQRIDAHGNLLWQQGGILVYAEKKQQVITFPPRRTIPPGLKMIGSGAGEAIITYQARGRDYYYIYAQKIDSEGNLQWKEGGVLIYEIDLLIPPHFTPSMVGDNSGGAVLVFCYHEKLRRYLLQAQRVDAEGKVLWPQQGVSPTTISGGPYSIFPDGEGGVFVAWVVWEVGPLLSYIQRITAEGERMWGDEGILLNP